MFPLTKARIGKYKIIRIGSACPGAKQRLTTLGIFVGDIIKVSKSSPGPVILEKNGLRVGIGHGMAMHITVEKIERIAHKKGV